MGELWQIDTRPSKAQARTKTRSKLRTWERRVYSHPIIAKCLLKCPSSALDEFLQEWAEFMNTLEYAKTKDRRSLSKSQETRQQPVRLKLQCHRLRPQHRIARNLVRKARNHKARWNPSESIPHASGIPRQRSFVARPRCCHSGTRMRSRARQLSWMSRRGFTRTVFCCIQQRRETTRCVGSCCHRVDKET